MENKNNNLWVLISPSKNIYALPVDCVYSFFQLNKITPLPKAKEEILGVIKYQGAMIQLVDIKHLFNLKTTQSEIEEFNALMDLRKQDHIQWIESLEKSVTNDEDFSNLETDYKKCAFGQWYESYDPNSGNLMFLTTFARFEAPHKEIHQLAITVKQLLSSNKKDAALKLIHEIKETQFQKMLKLFDDIKIAFEESKKEISVVFGNKDNTISFAVDEIVSVEELHDADPELLKNTNLDSKYISAVAKRKSGQVVFVLNHEYFLETYK